MADRRFATLLVAAVALAAVVIGIGAVVFGERDETVAAPLASIDVQIVSPTGVQRHQAPPRTVDVYRGLGTWVDGFDYSPPYAAGGVPPVLPADVNAMADAGVSTLYLQSGRLDDRSPDVLEDRWILLEFLMRAAQNDMAVVAWYLPKWTDDSTDLDHLLAAAEFDALGYRFDGVAVDIEWNQDGLEIAERNRRFVQLTVELDFLLADEPIGAIVLPPVQTEVINPSFWPEFPWTEIADHYDVWLPMSYWSFRTEAYGDGYTYNEESTRRLRNNLGDPDALVHAIGGIGGQVDAPPAGTEPYIARIDALDGFARSLVDTNAIGGSVYDWLTLDSAGRAAMAEQFSTGVAASIGEN